MIIIKKMLISAVGMPVYVYERLSCNEALYYNVGQ